MEALTVDRELAAIARQTRRLTAWSVVAHLTGAVLFLVVASHLTREAPTFEILTEITWDDAAPELAAAPAAMIASPAAAAVATPAPVVARSIAATPARGTPAPMTLPRRAAGPDAVQQRLAALRGGDDNHRVVALAGAMTSPRGQLAVIPGPAPSQPRALARAAAATVAAASMTTLPRAVPAVVDAVTAPPPAPKPEVAAAPAREVQPGVQLAGEVSDRALQEHAIPPYPQWAQRDGIEVSVRLHFTVLADGRVKENVRVEQTSGYDEFDRLAMAALTRWRFASLPPGATAEQWGRVEFKYRLRNAG